MRLVGMMIVFSLFSYSSLEAQEPFRIDLFDKKFSDWRVKVFEGKADYQIRTGPKPMVTLSTEKSNYMLVREFKDIDLRRYPHLSFEWMVERHPKGGDLRKKEYDDQAAGLYVTLPFFPELINYYSIGYVWENQAPPGIYPSRWRSRIRYVVLRSGLADLNQWQTEHRNLLDDFKNIWDITILQKQKIVVSLAANSNNTQTSSMASFGQIRLEQH
jgi:hypothetical protein